MRPSLRHPVLDQPTPWATMYVLKLLHAPSAEQVNAAALEKMREAWFGPQYRVSVEQRAEVESLFPLTEPDAQ